ncbi:MAG: NDP-hexose 4-ketoreductase, partial [Geodermatophilaceae bacterium]|nr:NDP-hexose 4-ketoreductase [Geodermatophilaceae bacterium]
DMVLEVTDAAKQLLAKRGFDPVLGARPLRRTIQREIEDALSEKILYGEISPGQIIVVDTEPGEDAEDETATKFTFRGELKPIEVPDAPPVSLSAGESEASTG